MEQADAVTPQPPDRPFPLSGLDIDTLLTALDAASIWYNDRDWEEMGLRWRNMQRRLGEFAKTGREGS